MKKFIPLLVLCLAVLCLFSSCDDFGKVYLEGTWKLETYSCIYRVVFSKDKVQIIEAERSYYGYIQSTDAMEPMPYTVGPDGVVTVSYSVGVMREINVTDTFTLDKNTGKLVWNQEYFSQEHISQKRTLEKESEEISFREPARGYEQYECPLVEYWEDDDVELEDSTLSLYTDGTYMWKGKNWDDSEKVVSTGHWTKSESEQNKVSLIPDDTGLFSRMDIEYVAGPLTYLDVTIIENSDFYYFSEEFDYLRTWYVELYH